MCTTDASIHTYQCVSAYVCALCGVQYTHAVLQGLHAPHCAASESDFGLCALSLAGLLVMHSRTYILF